MFQNAQNNNRAVFNDKSQHIQLFADFSKKIYLCSERYTLMVKQYQGQ